jgi:hypothetical protein
MAKIRRQEQEQREQREREAEETWRKLQEERRAAEQKRQEEASKIWERFLNGQDAHSNQWEGSTRQTHTSTCSHDGWWPKVQGRTACPECCEIWTYLLQCPACAMKACPRCQSVIRPRVTRNKGRTFQRNPPRERASSPDYYDSYFEACDALATYVFLFLGSCRSHISV